MKTSTSTFRQQTGLPEAMKALENTLLENGYVQIEEQTQMSHVHSKQFTLHMTSFADGRVTMVWRE